MAIEWHPISEKPAEGDDIIAARFVTGTIDWAMAGFYDFGELSLYPDYAPPPSAPTHWTPIGGFPQ